MTFFDQIVVHDLHKEGIDDTLLRKCHSISHVSAYLRLPLGADSSCGPASRLKQEEESICVVHKIISVFVISIRRITRCLQ